MKRYRIWILLAIGALGLIGWIALRTNSGALLSILQAKCLAPERPAPPCIKVDRSAGYVMLKDRKGSDHLLLLPIARISGIESDALTDPNTPNYFELAWENRRSLQTESTAAVANEDILLAVNSKFGRSQDQLHIHISCIKAEVKDHLRDLDASIGSIWEPLPGGLEGHDYLVRRVTPEQFRTVGAFRLLAFGEPQAATDMGRFSIAMTLSRTGDVLLLATERKLLDFNLASAEELQDQNCHLPG